MNIEAMTAAEDFCKKVLSFAPWQQEAYWRSLPDYGLTAEEVKSLQNLVGLFRMFTDERYYNAMKNAVAAQLWDTFNKERKG